MQLERSISKLMRCLDNIERREEAVIAFMKQASYNKKNEPWIDEVETGESHLLTLEVHQICQLHEIII